MNIAEMHVWFRQYAQQTGMQNVRAILPEQIDTLINTATLDTVNDVINRNVGTTNDRVITDNAKLASINALRKLYRVKIKTVGSDGGTLDNYKNEPYQLIVDPNNDFNIYYYVDFSVRYASSTSPGRKSRWFPIRIIDDSYLADVLNDWVLAPRMRTPVMVIYNEDDFPDDPEHPDAGHGDGTVCDIYFGENEFNSEIAAYSYIYEIRFSYIARPNKVAYLTDIGGTNVNSDLPEQLQIPMLKHAVDLYRISIQGSLYANQQNAQQNQQELVRNNARPDNDGYQS
jgi:hypothetical protein